MAGRYNITLRESTRPGGCRGPSRDLGTVIPRQRGMKRFRVLAALTARALLRFRPLREGAGKTGCAPHPRSRVQMRTKNTHTSIQVRRRHPAFPAQGRIEAKNAQLNQSDRAPVSTFVSRSAAGKFFQQLMLWKADASQVRSLVAVGPKNAQAGRATNLNRSVTRGPRDSSCPSRPLPAPWLARWRLVA